TVDDEGYVMLSLASFMDGKALYDETFSQYGPAYYVAEAALHRATGLPITHDVTRAKTLVHWLAIAALSAVLVARLTGLWPVAAMGFLVAFFDLERLCLEPGHPQELCLLALVVAPLLLTISKKRWVLACLGAVGGVAFMTKPNVG